MMRALATVFGVGHLPVAPGTWGTAAAIPLAVALHALGGFPALLLGTVAVFVAGIAATAAVIADRPDKDPSEVVIDEVAGTFVTLLPFSAAIWWMTDLAVLPWPGLVGAFVLFRVFDILKPWPVNLADRRKDALGVMLDDVLAGVYAGAALMLTGVLAHELLIR